TAPPVTSLSQPQLIFALVWRTFPSLLARLDDHNQADAKIRVRIKNQSLVLKNAHTLRFARSLWAPISQYRPRAIQPAVPPPPPNPRHKKFQAHPPGAPSWQKTAHPSPYPIRDKSGSTREWTHYQRK